MKKSMNESRKRMERLLLPRARLEPSGPEQPIPEAKNPLPRWQSLPLDAKFPVLPAPKGEVTFVTTKLGQARYKSNQHQDFDLSDPYNYATKSEYKPFFDPHLKGWLSRPQIQKQMRDLNLLTEKGNVPVSVRDFNDYRFFLRKQAVMEGGKLDVGSKEVEAQERKKKILAKTKMKAEVFGVEVKYKSLKAKQAAKEQEEDKRNMFLQKTESEEERQRQRSIEEEQQHLAKLKKSLAERTQKMEVIRERDELMRRKAEQKLIQFEMDAQRKLNKLDYLREQKFQELDQKRKKLWRRRRLQQQRDAEETQKQRQRVQAEMRTLRRRYEEQIARQVARDEVILEMHKDARFQRKERDHETYARRMARVLKDTRYMTLGSSVPTAGTGPGGTVELTRQASIWMVQEVLQRLGLNEESRRLAKDGFGSLTYLGDLDKAVGAAVRKLEGVTVLGEEQEMLSRLIHLTWRRIKTAYPGKVPSVKGIKSAVSSKLDPEGGGEEEGAEEAEGEKKDEEDEAAKAEMEEEEKMGEEEVAEKRIMEITRDEGFTTSEQLAWFFPDDDDGEEREQAVKISMLVTGEMQRSALPIHTLLGEPRPPAQAIVREAEEKMDEFFKSRMRMTETDALALEAELIHFLESLKEAEVKPKEMKKILAMCLRLANHDVIQKSDPCGELETNPDGNTYVAFDVQEEIPRVDVDEEGGPIAGTTAQSTRPSIAPSIAPSNAPSKAPSKAASGVKAGQTELESQVEEVAQEAAGDEAAAAAAPPPPPAEEEPAADGAEEDATENANNAKSDTNYNNRRGGADESSRSGSSSEESVDGEKREEDGDRDDKFNVGTGTASDAGETESGKSSRSSNSLQSDESRASSKSASGYEIQKNNNQENRLSDDSDEDKDDSPRYSASDCSGREESQIHVHMETCVDGDDRKWCGNFNTNKGDKSAVNISQNKNEAGDDDGDDDDIPDPDAPADEPTADAGEEETETEVEEQQADMSEGARTEDNPRSYSTTQQEISQPAEERDGSEFLSDGGEAIKSHTSHASIEQEQYETAVANDDIVTVATLMLTKVQDREKLKGVSIPQSRLLRFVAMNLSRLWRRGPDDRLHRFRPWLLEPGVPETIKSLIYNIKRRKFPAELQGNMAKAIVSECLNGVAYSAMPLTDGLVRAVLERFMADLEKDEVRMSVLEKVLKSAVDEYKQYSHMDLPFNMATMVLDSLGYAHDQISSGEVTKRGHLLPVIRNFDSMASDDRESLDCGNWPNLFHRTSVMIRLNMLSDGDNKNLQKLLETVCKDHIGPDAATWDLREMLDMMRNRVSHTKYKQAFYLDLAVNAVAILMESLNKSKVTSTTLLPGAQNTSQSACTENSASILGPYTSGESIILFVLDKLSSDMGTDNLEPERQGEIAAALVDLLVTQYNHDPERLKGEGLTRTFDDISAQLSSQMMNFRDAKRLLAATLRPYLASVLRPLVETSDQAPDSGLTLDEEQSQALLGMLTQTFLTFVHGIMGRLKRGGVKVEEFPRKIMSMYTWRALANLAKQARYVLNDLCVDYESEAVISKVKPSDSLILERIMRSVVDLGDTNTNSDVVPGQTDTGENEELFSKFLNAVLSDHKRPGYMPVADLGGRGSVSKRSGARRSRGWGRPGQFEVDKSVDPDDTPEEHLLRERPTPPDLDKALRREIIAASRDICEALVSNKALKQLTAKTADSLAGTVFVLEQLLDGLYNKLWSLRVGLQGGRTSPDKLVTAIMGSQDLEDLPQLGLGRDAAIKVVHEAIMEMETMQASATTLSRMVESLSRAAHAQIPNSDPGASSLRCQPHPILASASPLLLAQWARACLLAALSAVTIVISGGQCSPAKMKPPAKKGKDGVIRRTSSDDSVSSFTFNKKGQAYTVNPDSIFMATSYVAVHNMLSRVRDATERQKTDTSLWYAPRVAGTTEQSQVGVPLEILDRVFARMAGIMQTMAEAGNATLPGENDGRVPDTPSDLASTIITQVTSAVSYHVEIGQFPMIRINDLINPARARQAGFKKVNSSTNQGGKKTFGPSKSATSTTQVAKKATSSASQMANKRMSKVSRTAVVEDPASTRDASENNRGFSNNNSGGETLGLRDPVSLMAGRWSSYLFTSLQDIVWRLDNTLRKSLDLSLHCQDSISKEARVKARAYTSAMLDKIRKNAASPEVLLSNKSLFWQRICPAQAHPAPAASAATTASPAISRHASHARLGAMGVASSVNTNVNKTRGGGPQPAPSQSHQAATAAVKSGRAGAQRNTSVLQYVRTLLRPMLESETNGIFLTTSSLFGHNRAHNNNIFSDAFNNKSADVIAEILNAGYSVSLDLLRAFDKPELTAQRKTRHADGEMVDVAYLPEMSRAQRAVSVLLLDMLLEQLTSSLGGQVKVNPLALHGGRPRKAGRRKGVKVNPYVSSYKYRKPDPYGGFYAEVMDRGRRWCRLLDVDSGLESTAPVNVPRIHSLTRALLAPGAPALSNHSSQDTSGLDLTNTSVKDTQSMSSQPSCSIANSCSGSNTGVGQRDGNLCSEKDKRAEAWRKRVNKLSSAYNIDNTNNSWCKRSIRVSQAGKMPAARSDGKTKTVGTKPPHFQQRMFESAKLSTKVSDKTGGVADANSLSYNEKNAKLSAANRSNASVIRGKKGLKLENSARGKNQTSGSSARVFSQRRQGGEGDDRDGRAGAEEECPPEEVKHMLFPEAARRESPRKEVLEQDAPKIYMWQEPRVEVFYHVTEETRDATELHLRKIREQDKDVLDQSPLSCLELQILVLALLSHDLPVETAVLRACLQGQARLKLSSLADVTDLLSLLDHVIAEFSPTEEEKVKDMLEDIDGEKEKIEDRGAEKDTKAIAKIRSLLKAAGKRSEVSQRSAGAVHSLLRSVEYGLLADDSLIDALAHCSCTRLEDSHETNLDGVRNQLKSSLAQLVERLEEGHAPRSMTSSGWNRLARKILDVTRPIKANPSDLEEIQQCPNDPGYDVHDYEDDEKYGNDDSKDDDGGENVSKHHDQGNGRTSRSSERRSPRSVGCARSERDFSVHQKRDGRESDASCFSSRSQSRSSSRSTSRETHVSRTSACVEKDGTGSDADSQKENVVVKTGQRKAGAQHSHRTKSSSGSWSPGEALSASTSSTSTTSCSSSSSDASSPVGSASSCASQGTGMSRRFKSSRASKGSRGVCSVNSERSLGQK